MKGEMGLARRDLGTGGDILILRVGELGPRGWVTWSLEGIGYREAGLRGLEGEHWGPGKSIRSEGEDLNLRRVIWGWRQGI